MDMGSSDEEEEDGQVTKYDEEEEQDRKYFSKTPAEDEGPLTVSDLEHIRVSRDLVIKHCFSPWFSEFIAGAFAHTSLAAPSAAIHTHTRTSHRRMGPLPRRLRLKRARLPGVRSCRLVSLPILPLPYLW